MNIERFEKALLAEEDTHINVKEFGVRNILTPTQVVNKINQLADKGIFMVTYNEENEGLTATLIWN